MKKFLLILLSAFIIYIIFIYNKKDIYTLLKEINDEATVEKYYIYGNHMNIEGTINIENYNEIKLVLKNLNTELTYDINYNDGKFYTSSYINDGIYLDNIPIGEYIALIKIKNNDEIKYYNLKNNTTYNNTSYYTITKNEKNNLINIDYSKKENKNYLMIKVTNTKLPDNYYDIVIDPGHGGEDPGASFSNYTEAEINLDMALKLKKSLNDIGLKVILTRTDDTYPNTYGTNSRTSIPYDTKAKYFISLHLNSSSEKMRYGGIEVYAPNNTNLDLASKLANNIVQEANTTYSKNEAFNISNGVYIRTFTNDEVIESIEEAKKKNYNPYPITKETNYYFMIRETGGIATGAYVDGRNKELNKNKYYNSNIGAESYLLELGYINYWPDINNIVDNKDGYIKGITKTIEEIIKAGK